VSAPLPPGRDRRGDVTPQAFLRELGRQLPAPDLTGPVMSRLGLSPATGRAARPRRIARAAARLVLVALAVGAAALCVQWYGLGAKAPRPAGPTIPSAIRHDLEHHGPGVWRRGGRCRRRRGRDPCRPLGTRRARRYPSRRRQARRCGSDQRR
jgi:hypothetical protein